MYPVIRTGRVDGQDAMLSISTFDANVKVRQRSKQSFRFPNILLQKEKKKEKKKSLTKHLNDSEVVPKIHLKLSSVRVPGRSVEEMIFFHVQGVAQA